MAKDSITVLKCISPNARAVKTFEAKTDGSINKISFEAGYLFEHEEVSIENAEDIENFLLKYSKEKSKFGIRGQVKGDSGEVIKRRLRTGDAEIEEASRRWVCFDCDKIDMPAELNPANDPETPIKWLIETHLPAFKGITCVYKYSSSQNVPKAIGAAPDNKLSVHIFFMCDSPVSDNEWRTWAELSNAPVDPAVFGAVQPIFIASPKFVGMQDPLPRRIGLIRGEREAIEVSKIKNYSTPTKKGASIVEGTEKELVHASGRNEALFKQACRLRGMGYTEEMIRTMIHALNEGKFSSLHSNFQEGALHGSEVENIITSAMKYNNNSTASLTPEEALIKMNDQYAIVMESGSAVVISEERDEVLKRSKLNRSGFSDIKNFYKDRIFLGLDAKKKPIYEALGKWWLEHPDARRFPRVVFKPNGNIDGAYNLWRGFAMQPRKGACPLFYEHLLKNICRGNELYYQYFLKWLARMVQKPDRPGEVVIVLKGGRGTGKGRVATTVGRFFGQHFLQISSSKHLIGNFNAHMQDVVCLFCDEAFWAGDKSGESTLKTLVTENSIFIEPKGVDPFTVPNCLHIIMASNNDWVVPAGYDERRFFVLDVSDEKKQDLEYFEALDEEMENGGYEALLYDLLHMDISTFNFRNFPKTAALLEQKIRSLDAEHKWLFDKLSSGRIFSADTFWRSKVLKSELQADYYNECKNYGATRRSAQTELGMMLKKVFPDIETCTMEEKPAYLLPSLEECRRSFSKKMNAEIEWPEEEEEIVGGLPSNDFDEPM